MKGPKDMPHIIITTPPSIENLRNENDVHITLPSKIVSINKNIIFGDISDIQIIQNNHHKAEEWNKSTLFFASNKFQTSKGQNKVFSA